MGVEPIPDGRQLQAPPSAEAGGCGRGPAISRPAWPPPIAFPPGRAPTDPPTAAPAASRTDHTRFA